MSSPSKVLLLGSGFVAGPCLDILAEDGVHTTVGKLSPDRPLNCDSYTSVGGIENIDQKDGEQDPRTNLID